MSVKSYLEMFFTIVIGLATAAVLVVPIAGLAKWSVNRDWKSPWGILTYLSLSILYIAAILTGLLAVADALGLVSA